MMARQALGLTTAALLGGVAVGDALPSLSLPALLCAPLAALCSLLLRRPAGVLGALALGGFLAGAALPLRWTAPPGAADLGRIACEVASPCGAPLQAVVTGALAAPPARSEGGARLVVDVSEITLSAGRLRAEGRVLVYLNGQPPEARPGDRLRFRARLREPGGHHNPGGPDRARALARRGIRRVASIDSPEAIAWLAGPRGGARRLERPRRALRALLRREAGEASPVLEALLLGERGGIAPALRETYARAGVAHVLAVSGLHVGLVALAAGGALRRLLGRFPRIAATGGARRAGLLGGILAAWGYAFLAGAGEPALRAALMGTLLLAGALLLRRGVPWHAFWLAAACLTLSEPARIFEPAVQLSFASVAGLLWCWEARPEAARAPADGRAWRRVLRWMGGTVLAAVIATLATLPIQASVFGRLSLMAPAANLVVLPLLGGLALPLVLLAAAALPASDTAAALLVHGAAPVAGAATAAAVWFAAAPWAAVPLPPFTALEAAAYYALLAPLPLLLFREGRAAPARRRALAILAAGALAATVDVSIHLWRLRPPETLRLRLLDVGQGDAALVETSSGRRMLVDAGPSYALPGGRRFDAGARVVGPTLRAWWIRRIDVLAVTHPDADHAGGARAVLEGFEVGEIWIPAGSASAGGIAPLVAAAARRGVPLRALARGEVRGLDGATEVEVLNPPREARGEGWNDRSLVLRIRSPGLRALLAGDLEAAGERDLLRAGVDLRADVLKVGHHGSDTSSRRPFLAAVRPRVAVISAGAWNRFGFPAPSTLARLEAAGAAVFRTDRRGAITVEGRAPGVGGRDSRHSRADGIFVQWHRRVGRKGGRTGALFERAPPAGRAGRGDSTPTEGGP